MTCVHIIVFTPTFRCLCLVMIMSCFSVFVSFSQSFPLLPCPCPFPLPFSFLVGRCINEAFFSLLLSVPFLFFSSFLFSCSNPRPEEHFLSHCWTLLLCSSPSISPDLSGCCVNISTYTQPLQMSFVVTPVQDIRSTVAQRLLIVLRRCGLIEGGIDRWRVLVLWYCGIFPEKPKTPTTRQLPWDRRGRSREAASRIRTAVAGYVGVAANVVERLGLQVREHRSNNTRQPGTHSSMTWKQVRTLTKLTHKSTQVMEGRAWTSCKKRGSRLEVCRKLVGRCVPQGAGRKRTLLRRVLNPSSVKVRGGEERRRGREGEEKGRLDLSSSHLGQQQQLFKHPSPSP